MIYITEDVSAKLATHELAYAAVRAALVAAADPDAIAFPVVLGHAHHRQNRFTIKAATDATLTGLKVGSYFPSNDAIGQPRHNSITLIFDHRRGRIGAIVEGGKLNAYRTAAADAVATDVLARPDAETLVLFGTGNQAAFEAAAVSRVRKLKKILVVGRDPGRTKEFVASLQSTGLAAEPGTAKDACRIADIIVTATTSTAPLFDAAWVQRGTHVSSMGSDRTGKQELPTELFARASLFCDLVEQSRAIGEFQHADVSVPLAAIGNVLLGQTQGRTSEDEITVFDSSGISLQDLYMAEAIIKAHSAGAK